MKLNFNVKHDYYQRYNKLFLWQSNFIFHKCV